MQSPAAEASAPFDPFASIIATQAARDPRGEALRVDDRALDWRTLHRHVDQVGRALVRDGLAPGDRVAVLGYPSLAYLECFFGTIAARGCIVPLPVSASAASLEAMLRDSAAKLLFVDPDAGEAATTLAARLAGTGGLQVLHFGPAGEEGAAYTAWRAQGEDERIALPAAQPEDAFNIIYSSGTTGVPKGIVHQHGMRQRQASRPGFGFSPTGRTLLSTPLYSNTTIIPLLGTLANGGRSILMRRFDAGCFLALAAQHGATQTMLVPVQYQRILAHPDFARTDLSALAVSQSTGAPMDVALKQALIARWPGRIIDGYGLTEGGVNCYLDLRAHPDKLGTVGRPGQGAEVFLIDEAGRRLPEDSVGATGEVVGRSPFMMAGYHQRPDADAEIRWFDDQGRLFHRSGDIGRFDADGFLTLLDRRKDVIISGGNNIYAADLEAVLARHADVAEAAVIGVPSSTWGETPLALVVARAGRSPDAEALRDWANAQVGKTQRLAAVELRPELPRSALGKISKKELRAPYWAASQDMKTPTTTP